MKILINLLSKDEKQKARNLKKKSYKYRELLDKYERIDAELINISHREMASLSSKDRLNKMLEVLSKKTITRDMLNKDMIDAFFYKIIVCDSNKLVFIINSTHTMSPMELIEKRAEIAEKKAIYESSITGLDPLKKTTINYKVVLV